MTQITVPDVPAFIEYAVSTPSTGPFVVPFPFFEEEDVKATLTDSAGAETALVLTTDFTFTTLDTPVGQEGSGYEGGEITLVVAAGATGTVLKIYRDTTIDRTANFPSTGPFSMPLLNDEQNRYIAILQELSREVNAAVALIAGNFNSESSTDGWVLTSDGAGNAVWEAIPASGGAISSVVEDVTPQLGGDLDLNSNDVTGSGDITVTGDLALTGDADVRGTDPILKFTETDAPANLKEWRIYTYNQSLYIGTRDDADTTGDAIFRADRSGTTVTSLLMFTQLSMGDNKITKPHLHEYYLTSAAHTPTGTTVGLPYTASTTGGNAHEIDLASATGDVTATLSNIDDGDYAEMIVKVTQDATTPRNVTFAHATGNMLWPGGSVPTVSTGALDVDIFTFKTWDGGDNIYCNVSQDYS